jgi:hypothetical protein
MNRAPSPRARIGCQSHGRGICSATRARSGLQGGGRARIEGPRACRGGGLYARAQARRTESGDGIEDGRQGVSRAMGEGRLVRTMGGPASSRSIGEREEGGERRGRRPASHGREEEEAAGGRSSGKRGGGGKPS